MSGGRVIRVSAAQTVISTDKTIPAADGVEVTTIYITVLQEREVGGEALPVAGLAASDIVVAVSGTGNTVTQPTGVTGQDGSITASYVSTVAELKTISVTVCGRAASNSAVVSQGGSSNPPGLFFTDTFAGGVKTDDGGFTWSTTGSRVTVQLAPDSSGDYALRFRYGPDAEGSGSNAEQRFNMGRDIDEVWIDTYVWFPSNYVHRVPPNATNDKLLRLWADDYNALGKVGASAWYSSGAANDTVVRFDRNEGSGIGPSGSPSPELDVTLGAWTRVRWHFRYVESDGTNGLAELWIDATKVASWTFTGVYEGARPYWNNGYLFGAAGFLAETDFYLRGGTNGPKFYDTDPGWT